MSELGEYIAEEGRPLGDPTPPLVPLDVAPGSVGHHEPLDLGLLDEVDDGVQQLAVTPLSPKSKRLRDFEILVAAQAAEYEKTVKEAQSIIDQAKAEAIQVVRERDEARAKVPRPPPGPVSLPPCQLDFLLGGSVTPW